MVFSPASPYGADRVNPSSNTKIYLAIAFPVAIAALLIATTAMRWDRLPGLAEAAAHVESLALPGDLVLVTPSNRYPELTWFDESLDVVAVDALPPDLERFTRVILVRPRGDTPPSMRRLLASRARLLLIEEVRHVTIEVFQLHDRDRVISDLAERLPQALVSFQPQLGDSVPCPWLGDRFDCPEADWTWVGPTVQPFDGQPMDCVWMHPIEDAELVVSYEGLTGTHVTGWYGLTDFALAAEDGGPVRMRLTAGDLTGRFRAHQERGVRPLRFALPEDHDGTLEITVSASRAAARHFCWNLQTVESGRP